MFEINKNLPLPESFDEQLKVLVQYCKDCYNRSNVDILPICYVEDGRGGCLSYNCVSQFPDMCSSNVNA